VELADHYQELGLTHEASDTELKAAWRRLSARWHPDRNPSPQALQRIQRINRALEEIRRAREQAQDTAPDAGSAAEDPHDEDEDDAIAHVISLSLEEAACGCIRTVQGEVARGCTACSGSGEAPEPVPCPKCDGRGSVPPSIWFPWLTTPAGCDACGGQGSQVATCSCCNGSGLDQPLVYRARLRIPAGVRDGHELHARVKLKGRDGPQPLHVRIRLLAHEFMSLQDDGSIQLQVPVDGFAWIAGRWIEVPTPYGIRQMRLQRGALTYRIKDAGFPVVPSGARADCFVSLVPLFPDPWDEQQDALLDALIATNTADESTDAGARAQAWQQTVAAWRRRQSEAAAS
jgi:molecular chaperone DnaJ